MIKNCLFAVALASLALAGGCAKGGNGIPPQQPSVTVTITTPANTNPSAIYPGQPLTLTATVSNSTNTAVTWSLSCSGASNSCGTLTPVTPPTTPATAAFTAPPCVSQTTTCLSGSEPTVTATLTSDTSIAGPLALTIVDVTADVAPATLSIGKGLTQPFTAVAVPDAAETQSFIWGCTAGGGLCGMHNGVNNFVQDADVPGLAYYTADDNCSGNCVQISAVATLDQSACLNAPKNCTIAKASLVPSRVSGTYAFQFSGYDKTGSPVWVAGTFTTDANGANATGVEDVLTANGPSASPITIAGGSYTPISSSDPNNPNDSNNAGALTLTTSGVYPGQEYRVVLDGAGDIRMIESDGNGTGSGTAEPTSKNKFSQGSIQTFAFGFTGVDFKLGRVGYAGLLSTDGVSSVTGGLMDVNDNGITSSTCSVPPCNVAGGYTYDPTSNRGQLTLTSPTAMKFDFFVANGSTGTSNNNPLTLYAISTDPVTTNPAVLGTMVFQDSKTYDKTLFKGTSVSALTGVNATCATPPCTNVSLTLGTTDGNGNFSGQFDQNNAGGILSGVQFPPATGANNYTYAATGTPPIGRYTFSMLGDPTAKTVVAPLPFVLYASGANRGFLLEQPGSSPPDTSVMTGTMNPQGKSPLGGFSGSELPGTFAAATTSSGDSGVDSIAANLLLIWVNPTQGAPCASECVSGTQYDATNPLGVTMTGASPGYTLQDTSNGTIALTAPPPPSPQNYVIYVVDTLGCTGTLQNPNPVCAVESFLMIDEDKTVTNPSIIFAQQ